MHFIGVLNTKGGTGKTTLVSCLAVRAARDARVAVVDLDPQGSFTDWHGRRGAPDKPVLMRGVDRASDAVEALTRTSPYDFVFFDGPPGALLVTEDAVCASTLVVIPMRASGLDLAASQDCISLCQEMARPTSLSSTPRGSTTADWSTRRARCSPHGSCPSPTRSSPAACST